MPTPDPEPEKPEEKFDAAAAEQPNDNGSREPQATDNPPSLDGTGGEISQFYNNLTNRLRKLEDKEACLNLCDGEFRSLIDTMQNGPRKNLRAGIVLALVEKSAYHLARLNQHKDPLFKKFTAYQSKLLLDCNLGHSSSQVSRMRRAGALFIQLVEADQPVPETADRLIRLLPLEDAKGDYIKLAKAAGNKVPTPEAIGELMGDWRKTKDATTEAKTAKLKSACEKLLTLLVGQEPATEAARSAIQRLLEEMEAAPAPLVKAMLGATQSSENSTPVAPVQVDGLAPDPAIEEGKGPPAAPMGEGDGQGAGQRDPSDVPPAQVASVPVQPAVAAVVVPDGTPPAGPQDYFCKVAHGYQVERLDCELQVSLRDNGTSPAANYYRAQLKLQNDPAWQQVTGKKAQGPGQTELAMWSRRYPSVKEARLGVHMFWAEYSRLVYSAPTPPKPDEKP